MKRTILFFSLALAVFGQNPPNITTKQITLPISASPVAPTQGSATVLGNPGPATYYFWVVANFPVGNASPAGPFIAQNAPNTISASDTIFVSWNPTGAASYDLLLTNSATPPAGACNCAVATGQVNPYVTVSSGSTSAYTVQTFAPAALNLTLSNQVTGAGKSALTANFGGSQAWSVDSTGAATYNFITSKSVNGVLNVAKYPGATVGAQILNALEANTVAGPGTVQVPQTLAGGLPTIPWKASTAFSVGEYIVDANGGIQECTTAGTSGASQPSWSTTSGSTTADNSVVWTLQNANILNNLFFDLREGTSSARTTGRLWPYGNISLNLYDDSAATPSGTPPFEALNNSSPNAVQVNINETGAADPSAFYGNVSATSTGLGYVGDISSGLFNCTLNTGDTHAGCWGINEGVSTQSGSQTLQGNEVNLFNKSGTNANNLNGSFNVGPYWGFEATSSGTNEPTAAYFVDASSSSNRWYDGLFVPNAVFAGLECGHPGVSDSSPMSGGCVVSEPTAVATSSNNYSSYSLTGIANVWSGTASAPFDGALLYYVGSGTNSNPEWEFLCSQPGTPTETYCGSISLANMQSAETLTAGGSLANQVVATGAAASSDVSVSAAGSDTNISLDLKGKGTGTVYAPTFAAGDTTAKGNLGGSVAEFGSAAATAISIGINQNTVDKWRIGMAANSQVLCFDDTSDIFASPSLCTSDASGIVFEKGALLPSAQTLSLNGTISGTSTTGTGSVVLAGEPTITTPSFTGWGALVSTAGTGNGYYFNHSGTGYGFVGTNDGSLFALGWNSSPGNSSPTVNLQWDESGDVAIGTIANPSGHLSAGTFTLAGTTITPPLRATVSVTGTSLVAGACDSNTVTVTGATTTSGPDSAVNAVPQGSVGNGFYIKSRVSAANTVLVEVCAVVAGTPTTQVFNVTVF